MNRRSVLTFLTASIGGVVALVLGVPVVIFGLSPVLRPRPVWNWQRVGPLRDFPLDRVLRASVAIERGDWGRSLPRKGVYVWRTGEAEAVVFAINCTDLSCPVNWDPGSEVFVCPCHGGIFAKDGSRMAGPPRRPLFRYATRVEGGVLEVDLNSVPPMV